MEEKTTQQQAAPQQEYNPRTAANAGAKLHLVDPAGVPTGDWVDVMGSDSDTYIEKQREIIRRNNRELERTRKLRIAPPEQQEADEIELLVAVTRGWGGFAGAPFSAEALRVKLAERPDYREQVNLFVHDRMSFFRKAAKTS